MDETSAREADQREGDVDQTAADSDRTATDSDQTSSNGDTADPHSLRAKRQASSGLPDSAAITRTFAGSERDRRAAIRDDSARRRDEVAERLDRLEAERDSAYPASIGEFAAAARRRAAEDRKAAAEDRQLAAQDRLRAAMDLHTAHLDDLTGAFGRAMGMSALLREVERAHRERAPLVLAYVDIDGLKQVNDGLSHAAGDDVLRAVSSAIRDRLRSYDPMVRMGGDEFVCAISDTGEDGARERFDEVNAALGTRATISVGIVSLREHETLDELIQRGDAAMYKRKL